MKRNYRIRLATEHDLAALVRLEEAAFAKDRFTKEQIDYLLTASRATTFIIEDRSTTLGAACVLWRKSQRGARLYNIAVNPAYRGKGIGLIQKFQTILRRENYPNPYETLKHLTRGHKKIDRQVLLDFIDKLKVSQKIKAELKALTPSNYTGI